MFVFEVEGVKEVFEMYKDDIIFLIGYIVVIYEEVVEVVEWGVKYVMYLYNVVMLF